jgi:hypothetical protein
VNATPQQRAAAARLGTAYLIATAIGGRIDQEAIPSAPRNGSLRPAMLAALGKVYGSDDERSRQPGPYRNRYALYKADYDAVMPLVETTMRRWTSATLTAELVQFAILTSRLKVPAVGSDLHLRAERVGVAAGGYDPRSDEIDAAYGNPRLRQSMNPVWDPARERPVVVFGPPRQEERLQRLVRARVARAVAQEKDETLSTLFVHPRGVDILAEYRSGAAAGLRTAGWYVNDADRALFQLFGRLTTPRNTDIWSYPLLVVGGVASGGLGDVAGFPQYAASIGQVLGGSNSLDTWLGAAGIALLALTIVFTGPGAALILAGLDLALAGAGFGVALLRDLEQDLTAQATSFRPEEERLAEPSTYAGTLFAGAAALLSGVGFFGAAKEFRAVARARPVSATQALTHPEAAIPEWVRVGKAGEAPILERPAGVPDLAARGNAFDPATYRAAQRGPEGVPTPGARSTGQAARSAEPASVTARPAPEPQPPTPSLTTEPQPPGRRDVAPASAETPPAPETARGTRRSDSGRSTGSGTDEPVSRSGDPRATGEPGTGSLTAREQLQADREELRATLQAKIDSVEAELRAERRLKVDTQRQVVDLRRQLSAARRTGRAGEIAALEKKLADTEEDLSSFLLEGYGVDLARLRSQLGKSTEEHFLAITGAAARHPNSMLVRGGPASPLFRPSTTGTYSVEHIWPRSQMFLEPEFLKLTPRQQVALMAYRPNLIKIPGAANSARGNQAYRSISNEFTRNYLAGPAAQAELARAEELLKAEMMNLMKNPRLIPL